MVFCSNHSALFSRHQRNASFKKQSKYREIKADIMEVRQRVRERQRGVISWFEIISANDVPIKSLSSELRKPHERRGVQSVRARQNGGHQEKPRRTPRTSKSTKQSSYEFTNTHCDANMTLEQVNCVNIMLFHVILLWEP